MRKIGAGAACLVLFLTLSLVPARAQDDFTVTLLGTGTPPPTVIPA